MSTLIFLVLLVAALGYFARTLYRRFSVLTKARPVARFDRIPERVQAVLVYAFGIAALLLFSFTRFSGWLPEGVGSTNLFWLGGAWLGWLILITLAVGPTVGGFGLYTVSLGYLPASVANVIATLEPVMTAILAFILLGERFTPPQWAGSLLIIAGVIVLRVGESRARIPEPA